MIDLYFWTTPNGYKVLQFLEETGQDYRIIPVNISQGEQFDTAFLKISPNNKIPAIVDHDPNGADGRLSLFESGAILLYLAEKSAQLIAKDPAGRTRVLQWLFWQMAGLGPLAGQSMHFSQYAPEKLPYAIQRYHNETARLYQVMDTQLQSNSYLAGDFSIADIACYPWVHVHDRLHQELDKFPHLQRWYQQIKARPATARAYAIGAAINTVPTVTEDSKKFLLGQGANTLVA